MSSRAKLSNSNNLKLIAVAIISIVVLLIFIFSFSLISSSPDSTDPINSSNPESTEPNTTESTDTPDPIIIAPPDTTKPITTVSPEGGTYTSSQLISLVPNEDGITYYTTDGSTPTTESLVFTTNIEISSNTLLKFFTQDTSGNEESIKSELYIIDKDISKDIFGIKKIYPTIPNGNIWYMDMENPEDDPRFDPQRKITQNPDGSWKIQHEKVRMGVYSTNLTTYENTPIPTYSRTELDSKGYMQLPSDWKNFEMTGYVKLNEGSDDEFTWFGRGGHHNDSNKGCEGSSYKSFLEFDGNTLFAKETWHVNYAFSDRTQSTTPLLDRWIGVKFIVYNEPGENFPQQVHQEIWLDVDSTNNWEKVNEFIDDGFGEDASHCGPAFAEDMPITWGGPIVAFRADNTQDFDFKHLSVREIQVLK